jgi:hypothetical protein
LKTELERKGLDSNFKKIMFLTGIITGTPTGIFWIVQIGFYLAFRKGEPFFGKQFYEITYKWGIMGLAIIIIAVIITLILNSPFKY